MEIRGHAAVRAAAKDWRLYSSDLQGDPDVRDYRQLPLEADPPAHRAYRDLLEPFFGRVEVGAMESAIREAARAIVRDLVARGSGDAVHDLAFPVVLRSLAVAFRRERDLDEWRAWGLETWITAADGTRSGEHLDRYLARVRREAQAAPDAEGDVFQRLAAARIDGRPLTDAEFTGLAGLILAGGRDTVIKLVAGAVWHLAQDAAAFERLAADPTRLGPAIEEWLRYLSPLPRMPRVATVAHEVGGAPVAPGDHVQLSFIAANHDANEFEAPHDLRLDRAPNRHVAFGNGPHTCVGSHLARVQARVVLEELLAAVRRLALAGEPVLTWQDAGDTRVPSAFERVPISLEPR